MRQAAKKREAEKRQRRNSDGKGKKGLFPPAQADEKVLKNALADGTGIIEPQAIFGLRQRLGMSQAEFGRALGAWRGWPYSASYVSKLEVGRVKITRRVRYALARLVSKTRHLHILPPAVYAVEQLPPGTVILGRPVVCPICRGIFVMPWATQKYCSDDCRREARRQRRRERNASNEQ